LSVRKDFTVFELYCQIYLLSVVPLGFIYFFSSFSLICGSTLFPIADRQ